MHTAFTINWWALLLRGIAAIIFGVLAFVWPGLTLLTLVFLFGAYAIIDGIFALVAGFRSPRGARRWWWLALVGVVSVLAGLFAFVMPGVTGYTLLMLIAAWAIVSGIFEIVAAIEMRKEITGEWMLVLGGVASVVFGVLMMINPVAGALAVAWIIGVYAIVFGALLVGAAFRLRGWENSHAGATAHPA